MSKIDLWKLFKGAAPTIVRGIIGLLDHKKPEHIAADIAGELIAKCPPELCGTVGQILTAAGQQMEAQPKP